MVKLIWIFSVLQFVSFPKPVIKVTSRRLPWKKFVKILENLCCKLEAAPAAGLSLLDQQVRI